MWLDQYDGLIFESGQGLMLDMDCLENAPHLTSSKTGVTESVNFLMKRNLKLNEVIYVTRTYVTKHGAGPLLNAFNQDEISTIEKDRTNEINEWQGKIRYAKHESESEFMRPIINDIKNIGLKPSLAITHLNETNGKLVFREKEILVDDFISMIGRDFQNIYCSWNRYSIDKV